MSPTIIASSLLGTGDLLYGVKQPRYTAAASYCMEHDGVWLLGLTWPSKDCQVVWTRKVG